MARGNRRAKVPRAGKGKRPSLARSAGAFFAASKNVID
jgi:hypothetical protein